MVQTSLMICRHNIQQFERQIGADNSFLFGIEHRRDVINIEVSLMSEIKNTPLHYTRRENVLEQLDCILRYNK